MDDKGGTERPRLTFENTISKILEEDHVKKRKFVMYENFDDSRRGESGMQSAPLSLTILLGIQLEA